MSGCRRLLLWSVISVAFASTTGCSTFVGVRDFIAYNDATNRFVIGWRNEVWAQQSWHENKHAFQDQSYKADFGEGYRDGYAAVASGGNGCPPPLPPRKYWRWHYETPEGQAKIAAWFAGYPHGAAAAEQDNAGAWMEIPVSRNVDLQYAPEFENGTMFLPQEVIEEYYGPNGLGTQPGTGVPGAAIGPQSPTPAVAPLMHGSQNLQPGQAARTAAFPPPPAANGGYGGTFPAAQELKRLPMPPESTFYPNS